MVWMISMDLNSLVQVGQSSSRRNTLGRLVGRRVIRSLWRRTHHISGKRHSLKRGEVLASFS